MALVNRTASHFRNIFAAAILALRGLSPRVRGNLTHRGSPSVAGFLASEPRKSRRADLSWPYGTIAKSEIRA